MESIHESVRRSHDCYVQANKTYFEKLNAFVDDSTSNEEGIFLISGLRGSGKSALVSNWVGEYRKHKEKDDFLFFHTTSSQYASELGNLLHRLLSSFSQHFGISLNVGPSTGMDLRQILPFALEKCSKVAKEGKIGAIGAHRKDGDCLRKHKIVIVIDSIEQVLDDKTGKPVNPKWWLPRRIPNGIKIITTLIDNEEKSQQRDDFMKRNIFNHISLRSCMEPTLRSIFQKYHAQPKFKDLTIDPSVVTAIVTNKQCHNPEFFRFVLSGAFSILYVRDNVHHEIQIMNAYVKKCFECNTTEELLNNQLDKFSLDLEKSNEGGRHVSRIFEHCLCLLYTSMVGLSAKNLRGCVEQLPNGDNITENQWSLILVGLENLTFLYGDIYVLVQRKIVEKRYLKRSSSISNYHLILAAYFEFYPEPMSLRKIEEYPAHLLKIKDIDRLRSCALDIKFIWNWWNIGSEKDKDLLMAVWLSLYEENGGDLDPVTQYSKALSNYIKQSSDYQGNTAKTFQHVKEVIAIVGDILMRLSLHGYESKMLRISHYLHPKVPLKALQKADYKVPLHIKCNTNANKFYFYRRWIWSQFPWILLGQYKSILNQLETQKQARLHGVQKPRESSSAAVSFRHETNNKVLSISAPQSEEEKESGKSIRSLAINAQEEILRSLSLLPHVQDSEKMLEAGGGKSTIHSNSTVLPKIPRSHKSKMNEIKKKQQQEQNNHNIGGGGSGSTKRLLGHSRIDRFEELRQEKSDEILYMQKELNQLKELRKKLAIKLKKEERNLQVSRLGDTALKSKEQELRTVDQRYTKLSSKLKHEQSKQQVLNYVLLEIEQNPADDKNAIEMAQTSLSKKDVGIQTKQAEAKRAKEIQEETQKVAAKMSASVQKAESLRKSILERMSQQREEWNEEEELEASRIKKRHDIALGLEGDLDAATEQKLLNAADSIEGRTQEVAEERAKANQVLEKWDNVWKKIRSVCPNVVDIDDIFEKWLTKDQRTEILETESNSKANELTEKRKEYDSLAAEFQQMKILGIGSSGVSMKDIKLMTDKLEMKTKYLQKQKVRYNFVDGLLRHGYIGAQNLSNILGIPQKSTNNTDILDTADAGTIPSFYYGKEVVPMMRKISKECSDILEDMSEERDSREPLHVLPSRKKQLLSYSASDSLVGISGDQTKSDITPLSIIRVDIPHTKNELLDENLDSSPVEEEEDNDLMFDREFFKSQHLLRL